MKIRHEQRAAFTLIEMLLAIFIAVGLLMVAIAFYQSSARLRGELLGESEKLAAVRLLMDRMTSDLRTAIAEPRDGFTGASDSMKFTHVAAQGLMLVSFGAAYGATAETNAVMIGFNHTQQLLMETGLVSTNTNSVPFSFTGDDLFGTNNLPVAPEPTTRAIKHARFRYFNGSAWAESWSSIEPPVGVEISLGLEALSEEDLLTTNEVTTEIFRRVVYVPAGRAATTNVFEEELL